MLLLRRCSEKVRNDIDALTKRKAHASNEIREIEECRDDLVQERDQLLQIVEVYADQGGLVVLLNGCHAENDALRASAERHTLEQHSMREERDRLRRGKSEQTEKIIAETNIHGGDLREIDKNDRTQKTVSRKDRPKEIQKTVVGFF